MSVKRMHYDVKVKLNKQDSQQYRNLLIPEIDWALNEAQEIYIKLIGHPRKHSILRQQLFDYGFEKNQRNTDDIRTIVKNDVNIAATKLTSEEYSVGLPIDYLHLVRCRAKMTKGSCSDILASCIQRQHDDEFEFSPFDKSSFEWREVNIKFYDGGIKAYSDGSFVINFLCLDYIRKPAYIHNAEDYPTGTYQLPDGTTLTGFQDCELPLHTHREIVDIAVLVLTGQLQYTDYNIKKDKINLIN